MRRTIIARHKIKRAMRGKFSTFGELAAAADISTTTMTKATDSGEWRGATLDALAHALGVSSISLLEEEEVGAPAALPAAPPAPAPAASASARQQQRAALAPSSAQMPPIDPTLTPAEAARRAELLRQASGRRGK